MNFELSPEVTHVVHRMTTPYALVLGVGLASSSTFFFINIGLAIFGVSPATERARRELGMSPSMAVELWGRMAATVGPVVAASGMITTLTSLAASFMSAPSLTTRTRSNPYRYLHWMTAATVLSISPYTIINLFPINSVLLARRSKLLKSRISPSTSSSTTHPTLSPAEGEDSLRLLDEWRKHNTRRIVVGGVVWVMTLVGYSTI